MHAPDTIYPRHKISGILRLILVFFRRRFGFRFDSGHLDVRDDLDSDSLAVYARVAHILRTNSPAWPWSPNGAHIWPPERSAGLITTSTSAGGGARVGIDCMSAFFQSSRRTERGRQRTIYANVLCSPRIPWIAALLPWALLLPPLAARLEERTGSETAERLH